MNWYKFYKRFGIYLILLAVFLFFAIREPAFLSVNNLINILRQVSMFGIVIMGVSFIMISGGADLSVGGQMAMSGMFAGIFMINLEMNPVLGAVLCLLIGTVIGALNGVIIVKMQIMPMIVTLSTMLIWQGAAFLLTNGKAVYGFPKGFLYLGQGYIGPVPIPVVLLLLIVVVGTVLLNKCYIGRYIYAMGGNIEASRLAGIDVGKIRIATYAITGFLCALSGLIMASRTNSAQPGAGASYPFDCMTAAVLGGISIFGGEGKLTGALVGVLIIGILDNGLILMSVNSNWQNVIKGIVLLASVAIERMQSNASQKAKLKAA